MVDYVCRHIHKYSTINPKYNAPWTGLAAIWLPQTLCYIPDAFSHNLRFTALAFPQGKIRLFLKMLQFQFFTPLKIYEAEISKLFKFAGRRLCKKQNRKALRITQIHRKLLVCSCRICIVVGRSVFQISFLKSLGAGGGSPGTHQANTWEYKYSTSFQFTIYYPNIRHQEIVSLKK